jgi:hypothetical protein
VRFLVVSFSTSPTTTIQTKMIRGPRSKNNNISHNRRDPTRTRLLNTLGLFQQQNSNCNSNSNHGPGAVPAQRAIQAREELTVLGTITPFKEELKDDSDATNLPPRPVDDNGASAGVQFEDQVTVVQIPSRYQYSDRIKKLIWRDQYEIMEMAARNGREFQAEGYDWRNVVLDEDMYVDSHNGQLVHPCHLDNCFLEDTFSSSQKEQDDASFPSLQRSDSFYTTSDMYGEQKASN